MSLVVAVRTPDGIVLAADTLTSTAIVQNTVPPAQKGQPATQVIRNLVQSTTATKVFPFLDVFGVGAVGNAFVGGESLGVVLHELQDELFQSSGAGTERTLESATDRISARVRERMAGEAGHVRLLLCGHEGGEFSTRQVTVAAGTIKAEDPIRGTGTTFMGDGAVVTVLWRLRNSRGISAGQRSLTCRDAAAYASFLIRTTRDYQLFFLEPETVGGGVDIALIRGKRKFKWLKRSSHAEPGR